MNNTALEVTDLTRRYTIRTGFLGHQKTMLTAVEGVSFSIRKGEVLGLVGESGCGKSTTGRLVIRLEKPDEGRIMFDNQDITHLSNRRLRPIRGKMQIIFQDPVSSLNPRQKIGSIIEEPLIIHRTGVKTARRERVRELLNLVGLSPSDISRYPHQFSGGQRQRIGIARALALNPDLIVADEPVSALDVSIQAQIVNLLLSLQTRFNLSYLFISHDLSLVQHVSDRVLVMYLGRIVEEGSSGEVFQKPLHPYTIALLKAIPIPDPSTGRPRLLLSGDLPDPTFSYPGCPFEPRCPRKKEICRSKTPSLREISPGHRAACLLA